MEYNNIGKDEDIYELPPSEILDLKENLNTAELKEMLIEKVRKLQNVLYTFGVKAKVENVVVGPISIIYEIKLIENSTFQEVKRLKDDISLNLGVQSVDINIIPKKQLVGIEIEREEKEIVKFRGVIESKEFQESDSKLTIGLGKDVYGNYTILDIEKTSHILVAGTTGSGKSSFLHTIINSIIYKAKPSEVKFLMIDTQSVELSLYNEIPHLLLPVITNARLASAAIKWVVNEINNRYTLFATAGVKNIESYNEVTRKEKSNDLMTRIVIIIDDLADLMMMDSNNIESDIYILAKMAKNTGIYLVMATQRPSVNVITGTIRASIPTRLSFMLPSQIDSRIILDTPGAEKLLGNGEALFKTIGIINPIRYQTTFISNGEIQRIVNYIKDSNSIETYCKDLSDYVHNEEKSFFEDEEIYDVDPFLNDAIESIVEIGQASTSFIQRRFKIGYARAGKIIDQMEKRGIVSGYSGSKPREVLISKDEWNELKKKQ